VRRRAIFVGLLACTVLPARGNAQQVNVRPPLPESSSDSATQHYIDLLLVLRDTVDAVGARASQFRQNLQAAGEETVLAQAGRLNAQCRETRGVLERAEPSFAPDRVPARGRAASNGVRTAMSRLVGALADQCVKGLPPTGPGAHVDTLRAWGPYRTAELYRMMSQYEGAVTEFATSLGIRLPARMRHR
jgi:hypothetical protein